MTMDRGHRGRWWVVALLLCAGLIVFGANAGKMLVVDSPQPSRCDRGAGGARRILARRARSSCWTRAMQGGF